jgi:hypothetical protein
VVPRLRAGKTAATAVEINLSYAHCPIPGVKAWSAVKYASYDADDF